MASVLLQDESVKYKEWSIRNQCQFVCILKIGLTNKYYSQTSTAQILEQLKCFKDPLENISLNFKKLPQSADELKLFWDKILPDKLRSSA